MMQRQCRFIALGAVAFCCLALPAFADPAEWEWPFTELDDPQVFGSPGSHYTPEPDHDFALDPETQEPRAVYWTRHDHNDPYVYDGYTHYLRYAEYVDGTWTYSEVLLNPLVDDRLHATPTEADPYIWYLPKDVSLALTSEGEPIIIYGYEKRLWTGEYDQYSRHDQWVWVAKRDNATGLWTREQIHYDYQWTDYGIYPPRKSHVSRVGQVSIAVNSSDEYEGVFTIDTSSSPNNVQGTVLYRTENGGTEAVIGYWLITTEAGGTFTDDLTVVVTGSDDIRVACSVWKLWSLLNTVRELWYYGNLPEGGVNWTHLADGSIAAYLNHGLVLHPDNDAPRIVYQEDEDSIIYLENAGPPNWTWATGEQVLSDVEYREFILGKMDLDPHSGYAPGLAVLHRDTDDDDRENIRYYCRIGGQWAFEEAWAHSWGIQDRRPLLKYEQSLGIPLICGNRKLESSSNPARDILIVASPLDLFGIGPWGPRRWPPLEGPWFRVRDPLSNEVALFGPNGDGILMKGECVELDDPNAVITPDRDVSEFIVNNSLDVTLALVDSDTGDLYLKGALTEQAESVEPPTSNYSCSLVIRDNAGNPQAYIDQNGNLVMAGRLYEKGNLRPKESCGTVPVYASGSAMTSIGNAFLPLAPAVIAIAAWLVTRRRKRRATQ